MSTGIREIRIHFLSIFISGIILNFFSGNLLAQDQFNKNVILSVPALLELKLIKGEPDNRGTDIKNVYAIEINPLDKALGNMKGGAILYYLDGHFVEKFSSQTLPFSFKRNFSGQTTGVHEIKIEIEGANEEILASGKIKLEVVN